MVAAKLRYYKKFNDFKKVIKYVRDNHTRVHEYKYRR